MDRWIDRACRVVEALMALMLAAMVALVFGNVVLRYGFNSGITASEELSRWLFVWLTFLGAIVALRERAHLGVDALVGRLPPAGRKACLLASQALMLYLLWLLWLGSVAQVRINADVSAPVTGLPVAIVYAAGSVFAVAAGLLVLIEMLRLLRGRVQDEELVMVQESEEAAALSRVLAERSAEPPPAPPPTREAGRR